MQYVEAINQVLRRLRENQTSSPTATEYTTHIGALINEAKREVEDAWDWTALRTTITLTTVNGTSQYAIDISNEAAARQEQDRWRILQVYDTTEDYFLRAGTRKRMRFLIDDAQTGDPQWYYVEGKDSNQDPYINFWPIPDGANSIEVDLVLPQTDLVTGTTEILVPYYPVVLGAYAKAVAERGEDSGRTHGEVFAAYDRALADAIIQDVNRTEGEDFFFYV